MKKLSTLMLASALIAAPSLAFAKAGSWSLGAAVSYSPAVYKDTPSNVVAIPMVGYEGEHLFLRGFTGGYRLFPAGSTQNVIFRFAYDARSLDPSDSDDENIKKYIDERKAAVLGGVSYQLVTLAGVFEATAGSDIGSTHNGLYAEAAWRLPINRGVWGITPSIGYAYNSDKLNNHLYGVSSSEVAKATAGGGTLTEFDADWDGQYFVGLSGYMHLTRSIRVTGGIRYTNLEGDIEGSPILESGVNTTANVGIAYVF